ncbi:MAG: hypothetical protein OEZ04_10625, partial [Nitrospinota bacterium]|nr:hypothetical protein [Nitrospinota bacterium]
MGNKRVKTGVAIMGFGLFVFATLIELQACGVADVISDQKPATVGGVIATAGDGQNTIRWNVASNAASYNLYWDTESGVTPRSSGLRTGNKISGLNSTVYTHTGLSNGTFYYYIVTGVSEGGKEGDPS